MVFQRMAEAACTLRGQRHNRERCKCDIRGAAGSCRWNCQTPLEQAPWALWKQTVTGDYEDATPEDNVFKHWVSLQKLSDPSSSQHLKERKVSNYKKRRSFLSPAGALSGPEAAHYCAVGNRDQYKASHAAQVLNPNYHLMLGVHRAEHSIYLWKTYVCISWLSHSCLGFHSSQNSRWHSWQTRRGKGAVQMMHHPVRPQDTAIRATLQIEFLPWGEVMELARSPQFNFKCGYTKQ